MAATDISRDIARQAAHWFMLVHSGEAGEAQLRDCERWRRHDPEHERAWQRIALAQERFGLLPPALAMGTLGRSRRQALKTLLVLAATALPVGYAGLRLADQTQILADARTGTGERRTLTLADGSTLSLNSGSAIDVLFSDDQRLIRLRRGEILIDSGKDAAHTGYRPLRVATGQGTLQALGTRFLVRRLDEQALTRLAVFEGAVHVQPENGRGVTVTAGQQLDFSRQDASEPAPADEMQLAGWLRGQLVAHELALGDFLAELSRHREGWLRCDPAVAQLPISGTFQLDNIDAILAALPATLPVTVESRTRYWITVRGH